MSFDVDAIFDHGVFRPLEPLALPEGSHVHLQVQQAGPQSAPAESMDVGVAARRAGLAKFLEQMSALPLEGHQDPFSGADHDRVLYGQP